VNNVQLAKEPKKKRRRSEAKKKKKSQTFQEGEIANKQRKTGP